jgi:tetratricopeptide (TPR) repeat protein
VLWIDDLQWGDTDSIALVAELLEPPDQPVFLLLGTYRSHEAQTNPFLGRFRQIQEQNAGHLERVDLSIEPLSREEANRLAFALLDRDDPAAPARAEAIARECRGNPLFVYELVDFVQSGAGLEAGSGREISLDAVLLARVKRLPEPARRLLETVVVAARPIREDLACQAAALSADGRSWLSILRTGRLIRGTLSRELVEIEVYHDRIRETIAAQLSSSDIKAYHQNLARVLEPAAGTDPESLAIHFAGAGLLRQAARYYALAAGNAARSLAFDHASELYRLALAYQHSDEPARLELQVALADALANAGRGAEAAGEYLLAAGNTPSNDQANLLRNNATFQFLASGHIDEGLATIRDVLQSVGAFYPRSPLRALGSMLVLRALLRLRGLGFRERSADQVSQAALTRIDALFVATKGLGIVDPMRASYFQSLGVLAALRAGEPLRIAHSLAQQAGYESVYGTRSKHRSAQVIDLAHKMAGRLGDPYISAFTTYVEGGKAYLEGRWKDALELCDKAEAMYRNHCTGVFWELDTTQTFSLWSLTYLGEIRLLSERRSVLLKSARERGDLFAATNFGTYIMSLARLGADDPEGAQRELDDVMRRWSQQGFHLQHHNAVLAQGYIDLYRGDGAAAWDHLAAKKPRYKQSLLSHVQHVRIDILQLRGRSAIAAAADGVDARAMLASARRIARQLTGERADWATALAVFIRACAAACESRSGEAVELLRWALQRFEAVDMNLFAAACRRRLGQLTGGSESRKKIEQADAWMARQGIKNPERMTAMMAPGFRD